VKKIFSIPVLALTVITSLYGAVLSQEFLELPFSFWTVEHAVGLLNDSPWAKQTTFTRVIEGVGSGVLGEKEIYNTFYTRLLSARPVREAFARVEQINHGYDSLSPGDQENFDELIRPGLELDVRETIVVSVSFRSNDPDNESRVTRYLRSGSADSFKRAAFLVTAEHPRVEILDYVPPSGDGTGGKFVFPRSIDGMPLVGEAEGSFVFELYAPVADPHLAVTFVVKELVLNGKLVL
jgi:hypothetical protein